MKFFIKMQKIRFNRKIAQIYLFSTKIIFNDLKTERIYFAVASDIMKYTIFHVTCSEVNRARLMLMRNLNSASLMSESAGTLHLHAA